MGAGLVRGRNSRSGAGKKWERLGDGAGTWREQDRNEAETERERGRRERSGDDGHEAGNAWERRERGGNEAGTGRERGGSVARTGKRRGTAGAKRVRLERAGNGSENGGNASVWVRPCLCAGKGT